MTNIYPYVVDTDMFAGVSFVALNILPKLRKKAVAHRIYTALSKNEEEVYLPWFAYWLGVLLLCVPGVRFKGWLKSRLMGDGMKTMSKNK